MRNSVGSVKFQASRPDPWTMDDSLSGLIRFIPSDSNRSPEPRQIMTGRTSKRRCYPAHPTDIPGDDGFSMIATALGLLATAVLTAILLGTMLNSNGSSSGGASGEPGVAEAKAIQAQQTLAIGLTTAETAAVSAGGYGALQPSTLTASNPSITFVSGPSTNANTLSMAVVGGSVDQAGSSGGATGVAGAISAAGAAADGQASTGAGGGSGETGSITLADRSTDGTCWLVWKAADGSEWYGAETGLASCTAPALSSTPSAGPVTSSSIGWQQGTFPSI